MTATMPIVQSATSCTCAACVSCCERFPGWMTPRDVRRLAEHLGVTPRSLFQTHLAWDRYFLCRETAIAWGLFTPEDEDDYDYPSCVWIALPASATARPGEVTERPWLPLDFTSRCALLKDGLCTIHDAKPRECRSVFASRCETNPTPFNERAHELIARAWARPAARRWRVSLAISQAQV